MKVDRPPLFTSKHNTTPGDPLEAYVGSSNAYDVYVYDDVVVLRFGDVYDQFLYFRNKDVFRRFAEVRVDFTTPLKLITKEENQNGTID